MFSSFPLANVVYLLVCLLAQPANPTPLGTRATTTTCRTVTVTGGIHTIIHGGCVIFVTDKTATHTQTTSDDNGNPVPTERPPGHGTIPSTSMPTAPPTTDQQRTSSSSITVFSVQSSGSNPQASESSTSGLSSQSNASQSIIQMPSPSTSSGGISDSTLSTSRSRITAIILGSILGVAIIASTIFVFRRRRRDVTPRPLLSEKQIPSKNQVSRFDYPATTAQVENGEIESIGIPMSDASIRRLFHDRGFESQLLQVIQRPMDRTRRVSSSGSLPPAYDAI